MFTEAGSLISKSTNKGLLQLFHEAVTLRREVPQHTLLGRTIPVHTAMKVIINLHLKVHTHAQPLEGYWRN